MRLSHDRPRFHWCIQRARPSLRSVLPTIDRGPLACTLGGWYWSVAWCGWAFTYQRRTWVT